MQVDARWLLVSKQPLLGLVLLGKAKLRIQSW
jgi:hypothetical protein